MTDTIQVFSHVHLAWVFVINNHADEMQSEKEPAMSPLTWHLCQKTAKSRAFRSVLELFVGTGTRKRGPKVAASLTRLSGARFRSRLLVREAICWAFLSKLDKIFNRLLTQVRRALRRRRPRGKNSM